jgi:hypothetical protein
MEFGDLTPPGYDHLDAGIRPSNRKQRAIVAPARWVRDRYG